MIKVYEYTRQPPYWVVCDDDGYWLVPARHGGWQERTPFVGRTAGLREIMPPPELDAGGDAGLASP